ncbi:MAG: phosphatase PAP2 family protein [Dethiobacteria bacterium]
MNTTSKTSYYFSEKLEIERLCRWGFLALAVILGIILYIYWDPLRSNDLVKAFHAKTVAPAVEYFFRSFTFLGDDQGFIIIITLFFWCINKTLGFGTLMVLIFSGIYTYLLKEYFMEPRPLIEGVTPPEDSSFPSGHTLSVLAVWTYLAANIKRKGFWILTVIIIALVGLSRIFIGVHFPGDVIGGLVFGIIFIAFYLWAGNALAKRKFKSSFRVNFIILLLVFTIIFFLSTMVFPGNSPPKVMGFFAGLCLGYLLEEESIKFETGGKLYQHVLKMIIGLAVLLSIQAGLKELIPATGTVPYLCFARYFLAGFWVTFLAPLVFVATGLASREKDPE